MSWNKLSYFNLKEQLPYYIFFSVLFMVGVIFGALMVNALSLEQRQDLEQYLNHHIQFLARGEFLATATFFSVLWAQFKWIGVIFLLGISVIGLPLIFILNFLKGVLIGFTVGYFVGQFSWKGLLFSLLTIAPHNLIMIPIIIMMSVVAISFSIYFIKHRVMQNKGDLKQTFGAYMMMTFFLVLMLNVSASIETWITPKFMTWFSPKMLSIVINLLQVG